MTLRTFLRAQGAYIIMVVVIIFHFSDNVLYFRSYLHIPSKTNIYKK